MKQICVWEQQLNEMSNMNAHGWRHLWAHQQQHRVTWSRMLTGYQNYCSPIVRCTRLQNRYCTCQWLQQPFPMTSATSINKCIQVCTLTIATSLLNYLIMYGCMICKQGLSDVLVSSSYMYTQQCVTKRMLSACRHTSRGQKQMWRSYRWYKSSKDTVQRWGS